MTPTPLTDEQVVSAIEAEEAASYGYLTSELAEQRSSALDRYLARPYGDEIEGRSRDALETILAARHRVDAVALVAQHSTQRRPDAGFVVHVP